MSGRMALSDFREIEMALLIDRDNRRLATAPNERFAIIQNSVVLDRGGDDMLPLGRHLEGGMERGVIRFRPAAGENDLVRLATEQGGDALVREFDRFLHLGAETMRAGRIPVLGGEKRHHLLQDLRVDPGAGVVIEINDFAGHESISPGLGAASIPAGAVRSPDVAHGDASNGSTNCAGKSATGARWSGRQPNRGDKWRSN